MKRIFASLLFLLSAAALAASTVPPQLISPTGSSTGQAILSNGGSSAPTWQTISSLGAVTFSGAITPSQTAGIVGTTAANNANAGSVGELLANAGTGTSLVTATAKTSVQTTLSAGDWEVSCVNAFNPAGSTTVSLIQTGISTTNNTFGSANSGLHVLLQATLPTGGIQIQHSPTTRISVGTSAPVYCIAAANFGVSTMTVDGFIRARRVR